MRDNAPSVDDCLAMLEMMKVTLHKSSSWEVGGGVTKLPKYKALWQIAVSLGMTPAECRLFSTIKREIKTSSAQTRIVFAAAVALLFGPMEEP